MREGTIRVKVNAAILGTGNIGSDLMVKMLRKNGALRLALFAGIDPDSAGLRRAGELGVRVSADGIDAVLRDESISIVFDATSAHAHLRHAPLLRQHGKYAVDMTPAAVGPYYVPAVGMPWERTDAPNLNMVTCGGQGAIPIVYAAARAAEVAYAETVSTIASVSAGPGTRSNIDEFTVTTARAVRDIGGAARSKAIIILNPAVPPILAQNTIYVQFASTPDREKVLRSIHEMVSTVQTYVPGYRLKYEPVFDDACLTVMVEVAGAGDFLPVYAGNLDIMTASALAAGEHIADKLQNGVNS